MNYGELRTFFQGILNRDDCDDNLADQFIALGLRRTERSLRTPMQRFIETTVIDGTFDGTLGIPTNFLGLYEVRLNGVTLRRVINNQQALFNGFYIEGVYFKFTENTVSEGDTVEIDYYVEFDPTVLDGDITNYSLIIGDVIIYAALGYAASYFVDSRKGEFDGTFIGLVQETQMMADMDAMNGTGMAITPYGGGVA